MKRTLTLSALLTLTIFATSIFAQTTIITTVAGNGVVGNSPDSTVANNTSISYPNGLFVDHAGNIYYTEESKVRRIDAISGLIATIAGTGISGFSGDGGPATSARLYSPTQIAFDAANNIYIADPVNTRIRKINAGTGTITTIAGISGIGYTGNGGAATAAKMFPVSIAFNRTGDLFVAEGTSGHIRKIDMSTGIITNYAGSDSIGGYGGDGGPATDAVLDNPAHICFDTANNLYLSDFYRHVIRKISPAGVITTVAGIGYQGFNGDNGPATAALLFSPSGLCISNTGDIIFADYNNSRIRSINAATGIITTLVGNGNNSDLGDGGPAINAELKFPANVCIDDLDRIYISTKDKIRRTSIGFPTGIVNTMSKPASIYPNPSTGTFHITLADATPHLVDIFDITGKNVGHSLSGVSSIPVDMGNMPDGIYTISITTGNHIDHHKIIIRH